MKRAMCIWLPHWPLQRLALRQNGADELSDRAVVLYECRAPYGVRVVSYCPRLAAAAAALWTDAGSGICPGMPLAEATALAGIEQVSKRTGEHIKIPSPGTMHSMVMGEGGERSEPGEGVAARVDDLSKVLHPHPGPLPSREREDARAPLLSCSPAPLLCEADPLADRAALEELAEWCQRYSPTVAVEEAERPESLLLDASSLDAVFGGERSLAQRVVREFRDRGLTVRVAIADTPGAAWAVARYAPLEQAGDWRPEARGEEAGVSSLPSTLVGEGDSHSESGEGGSASVDNPFAVRPRIPALLSRPCFAGCPEKEILPPLRPAACEEAILRALAVPIIVPVGQTSTAIGPLSIEALRLPEEACALLAEVGLRRIEQLAPLPRATLPARFGIEVLERLDQATGAVPEAIIARAVPEESEFERLLEYPTARREMLELVLSQLIASACDVLGRQRRGLLRFACRFESEDRSAVEFVVGLYRASASPRHVAELARLKFERLRFHKEVSMVRLTVLATDRLHLRQQVLFESDDTAACAPRELAALVDRLSNRLGWQAVLRPRFLASALPEFACQYQALASLSAAESRSKTHTGPKQTRRSGSPQIQASATPAGNRPLHLEPQPLPLSVISVAPEGPPMQFRLAGKDHRTSRAWGPERIETRWWRTRCVRRDYYQVETGDGQRFWLFRQLNTGQWFLHGQFA